ncbi:MAG: outer membrane protein assembly factor BamB [Halioglobus sp.]
MHRLFPRPLLVVSCALFLAGCSTVSGWFSDDDEDPTQPAELMEIVEKVKIKRLWSVGIGDGQGAGLYRIRPVIQGYTLYIASADGKVRALQTDNGKTLWKADLDRDLSGGVGVYNDALFLGGSEGSVLKLDASSGELLWSTQLKGEILAAPQGNGQVVVAQSYDGKLQGLDYETGELLWTHDSNVPVLTIRGTSTPNLSDNTVYAGFASGRVLAFDARTGAVRWEIRVTIPQGRSEIERIVDIDGSMELAGNELYAASYQGRLVAIDVAGGRKLWQQDVSSFSGVAQGFGNVYVADADGTLYAYMRTGAGLRWSQGELAYRELSRPTPVSSYVAVADFEGYVHLVSQVDGEIVGRVKVDGDGVRADMLSEGNVFYVYGNSGKLGAYEVTAKE